MKNKRHFTSASVIRAGNNVKTRIISRDSNGAFIERETVGKSPVEIRNAFKRASKKIA